MPERRTTTELIRLHPNEPADLQGDLPPWLVAFVREAQRETDTLEENGAEQAAAAAPSCSRSSSAPSRHGSTPNSTLTRPPRRAPAAKRRSAVPSERARSRTAGPIRAGATRSAVATCTSLPPPPAARMIPMPMPRTSPDSGGRYETPEMLVEVYRRTRGESAVVRRPPGRPAQSVGLHQRKGETEVAGAPRQRGGDPASLRAAPVPALEPAGVGPGDAHRRHDVAALPGKPSAPEQEAANATLRSAQSGASGRVSWRESGCGNAVRIGRAALHDGATPGRPESQVRGTEQTSPA